MDEISFEESTLLDVSQIEVDSNNNISSPASSVIPVGLNLPMSSTPKTRLKCGDCHYTTTSSGSLSRHKRCTHMKEKVSCTRCTEVFSSPYDLNQHVRVYHNKVQLLCEICSGQFNNRTTLARHRRVHHSGQNRFVCENCGKQFFEKAAYIGHMNKHIGSRPFACTTCERAFKFKNNLRRHMQTCQNRSAKSALKCDTCGAELNSKASLNDHVQGKHGPKKLLCACGKAFTWRPSFGRHQKKCRFAQR